MVNFKKFNESFKDTYIPKKKPLRESIEVSEDDFIEGCGILSDYLEEASPEMVESETVLEFTSYPELRDFDLSPAIDKTLEKLDLPHNPAERVEENYRVVIPTCKKDELRRIEVALEGVGFFKDWVKKG